MILNESGSKARDIPVVDIKYPQYNHFSIRRIKENPDFGAGREVAHRHNFQEIFWFRSGDGKQSIDDQTMEISANTFYLVTQGQIHRFIDGKNLDGFVIEFTNNFLLDLPVDQNWIFRTSLFSNISSSYSISVKQPEVTEFDILIDQIFQEYSRENEFGKFDILRHLLNIVFIKIQRCKNSSKHYSDQHYSSDKKILSEFLSLLEEYYTHSHNILEYADKMSISPRQLNLITKHLIGRTPKEVLLDRLMLEAKRLLTFSDLSIKEIAYALGYHDPSYFSRVFRKMNMVSPQKFLEKSKNI